MNARQFTLILVVAVVLGAAGWVLFHRGVRSWESEPLANQEKVLDFPLNDVAHITIKNGTGELNLVRKSDGWGVGERADYPADFEQVSRFLQKIWNLKPVETVQVGPSQFARLELTDPAKEGKSGGTLLDLKGSDDKRIAALLIGKQYLKKSSQGFGQDSFPAGRYVMPESEPKHVFLISDPLPELATDPQRWLSRDFIKIEKPNSILLDGTDPEQKWKIERAQESSVWKFAPSNPGEELDPSKAAGLSNTLSNLHFTDVLDPNAKAETTGLDKPARVVIEVADGFVYTLNIGKLSDEKYPMTVDVAANIPLEPEPSPNEKPEDKKRREEALSKKKTLEEKLANEKKFEGRPFLLLKGTIDQLLKNRADLIKAPPTPSPSPAASVIGKAAVPPRPPVVATPKKKP